MEELEITDGSKNGSELTVEQSALVDKIVQALSGDGETSFMALNQSMEQQKDKDRDGYENIIVEARRRVKDIAKQREALQREQGNNN